MLNFVTNRPRVLKRYKGQTHIWPSQLRFVGALLEHVRSVVQTRPKYLGLTVCFPKSFDMNKGPKAFTKVVCPDAMPCQRASQTLIEDDWVVPDESLV